jgi:hypothetical protein
LRHDVFRDDVGRIGHGTAFSPGIISA